MRVQRKVHSEDDKGNTGSILSHDNQTLRVHVDGTADDAVCEDAFWNWLPLDAEAAKYLQQVEDTSEPAECHIMGVEVQEDGVNNKEDKSPC